MKKFFYIILFVFISIVTGFSQNKYQPKDGLFDFSNASMEKIYPLEGQWEFYWDTLLNPQQIKEIKNKEFIKVNSVWNTHTLNGKKLPGDGVATYHIMIVVPYPGNYSIKFYQVLSAYQVYVNGNIVAKVGKVSKDKSEYKGVVRTNIVNFHTDKDTVDVVVQVANYSHVFGGIQEKVLFGKSNVVEAKTARTFLFLFLKTGAEIIFALYFFFSFFFRQKDLSYIFFSLAILLTVIFDLVNNEMPLLQFFPNMPFELQKKLDFFSDYARLSLFTLFLWYSFKEYKIFNKIVFYIVFVIPSVLAIFVLFTPCKVYSSTLIPFEIVSLFTFLYFFGMTLNGVIKKIPFIGYTFVGLFVMIIGLFNDIMTNINIINTPYLLNYSLLIFFIAHSITLSLKYSSSIQQVSILSKHFARYEKILSGVINYYSYDLEKILDNIKKELNVDEIKLIAFSDSETNCECRNLDGYIRCAKAGDNIGMVEDEAFVSKIKNIDRIKVLNYKNLNYLVLPIEKDAKEKDVFLFIKKKNIPKALIDLVEMLSPQLSTFIDNYKYYYQLQNINANLEKIIEERSREIIRQKKELEQKNEELTEKIEELNISSKIIEELNHELEYKRDILNKKKELLEKAKQTILEQKKILEENEDYIKQSIIYAKKIQEVLYSEKYKIIYENAFLCASPRDIISGDLVINYTVGDTWYVGIIDTTANNVSAVFVGFLIYDILDDIIDRHDLNTAEIIKMLRYQFIKSFIANVKDTNLNVQFDISLAAIDMKTGKLIFSSTKFPALIVRNREPIPIYGDNFPIGNYLENSLFNFSTATFNLRKGDNVYLFSDGFYNQLNEKGKKYTQRRFFDLLSEISYYQPDKQKEKIQQEFMSWMGKFKRIDDFSIIGFKFQS